MTFRQCAKTYLANHASGWKNAKHRWQWKNTLETYAYPVFAATLVSKIDASLVMAVLEPIWLEKHETATRLRGRIEAILDWAAVRGYRKGDNPARWRGHLQKALPTIKKYSLGGVLHRPRESSRITAEPLLSASSRERSRPAGHGD